MCGHRLLSARVAPFCHFRIPLPTQSRCMLRKMGKRKLFGFGAVAVLFILYFLNASWLAPTPSGRPTVIAQRGVHQVYEREGVDDATCTARHIPPPSHTFIDNTLPSIAAAFAAGADVVEVDVRLTADRHFVLFHDYSLECRTDGKGPVASQDAGLTAARWDESPRMTGES